MRLPPGALIPRQLPLLLALAVAACVGINDPRDESRTRALAQIQSNQSAWNSLDLRFYDFSYSKQCSCASANQGVIVHVRNGSVQSVTDSTGVDVTTEAGMAWPTVDSLFARARAAVSSVGLATRLQFDLSYFYPTLIESFDRGTGILVRDVSADLAPMAVP